MTTPALIQVVSGLAVAIAILMFVRRTSGWADCKQENLLLEKTSPKAEVRGCCMVHETYYEQPGVAQVLDGKLGIYTVLGDVIVIPMAQVKLVKVRKNRCLLGRYPWWGKTGFWLETPKTSGLVLGVDDPEPWHRAFEANDCQKV